MSPKNAVAESWEDEESETATEVAASTKPSSSSSSYKNAPVASAYGMATSAWGNDGVDAQELGDFDGEAIRRPEKTDAVARRMIAAGLGLRAPKQTEEQKAYQKSIREQEKRKREQERLLVQKRKEEEEKAKAAIWDD